MTAKVALVTGASRGVGAATAIALADAGYAVACAARSTAENPQRTPGTIDHVVDQIREGGGTALANWEREKTEISASMMSPPSRTDHVRFFGAELGRTLVGAAGRLRLAPMWIVASRCT